MHTKHEARQRVVRSWTKVTQLRHVAAAQQVNIRSGFLALGFALLTFGALMPSVAGEHSQAYASWRTDCTICMLT